MADFAREQQVTLMRNINEGDVCDKAPKFYIKAVKQYLEKAAEIQKRYEPTPQGVLVCGSGDCGQLGSDQMVTSNTPKEIINLRYANIKSVACGGLHNAAINYGGSVYTWGCNDDGSLGRIDVDNEFTPIVVEGFLPSRTELAVGLGEITQGKDESIVALAAGDCQTLALSSTGRVYMFGAYKDVEGKSWRDVSPSDERRSHPDPPKNGSSPKYPQYWPQHVWQMPGKCITIQCGASFNAAIVVNKDNGNNMCVTWGIGTVLHGVDTGNFARPVDEIKNYQYDPDAEENKGNNDPYAAYFVEIVRDSHLVPKPVLWDDIPPSLDYKRNVLNVACGGFHLLVIANDVQSGNGEEGGNAIYSCGLNNYGQLGLGDTKNRDKLIRISSLDGKNISKTAAGQHHSLCLNNSGTTLYSFGRGDSGQLGITSTLPPSGYLENQPMEVSLINNKSVIIEEISCGDNHNLALTFEKDVYTWGFGEMSALGHAKDKDEYCPKKVILSSELKGLVREVKGGGQHSAIVLEPTET